MIQLFPFIFLSILLIKNAIIIIIIIIVSNIIYRLSILNYEINKQFLNSRVYFSIIGLILCIMNINIKYLIVNN